MNVTAIIVAAGEGHRLGGAVPKVYLPVCGRPIVLRTLDRFCSAAVQSVVLVVAAGEMARCAALVRDDAALRSHSLKLQSGGATRQQSVQRGLESMDGEPDVVVIHDGARPFVSPALIERCVEEAGKKGAVVAGLPVRDTIKVVSKDQRIETTPARSGLWEIQTPQAFHRELIIEAHRRAAQQGIEATDDATLVEQMGKPVFVVDGERWNFKITLPEDLWLAESLIRAGRVT